MKLRKAKPDAGRRRASQGANAWTAASDRKDTATVALRRILALSAMDAALEHFDACALATDNPAPGMVEANDLLHAARALLAGAP